MTATASAAPVPLRRPAANEARPSAPVTTLPIGSLPRDRTVTSMPASGWAVCSERAKTFSPSSPLKEVRPMSVSITHRPAAAPLVDSSSS